ncbi:DEAD/DEAH box helicase [Yinghuangia seranimata]|uniref:DEAD/DEAH box helicase n=1 Tax=Yinghuangia seranimata TaxID=408067 RepID=UPI00248CA055|nr:DEAD/DEAH box helicase [Yinghuangia seranimata]MDI2126493.1 SNF2-related protein [Yinghuangia seranimata]
MPLGTTGPAVPPAVTPVVPPAAAAALARCAPVFTPADPPRAGHVDFWSPDGVDLPAGAGELVEVPVAAPPPEGGPVALRTVPALRLPVASAVPVLTRARTAPGAHRAAAFWGAVCVAALQLVARGRILPGVTPGDHDAWRAGPLDAADLARVRDLAAAMPPEARAVPVPASDSTPTVLELARTEDLVRALLDAIADGMPRSAAAARATGSPVFAATAPLRVPRLRPWADEVAAGRDRGLRLSLRVEAPEDDLTTGGFTLVVQAHSLADPTLVTDAARLWDTEPTPGFGSRARLDATSSISRAADTWPVLERLLNRPVPDRVELADDELGELLSRYAAALSAAGVDVHWPKHLVRRLTAKAVIGPVQNHNAKDEGPTRPATFGGDAAFAFNWRLALGDSDLTDAEMDALAESHRPVVRLRDRWTLVDPELLRKARERDLKPLTAIDALGAALTGTADVDGVRVPVAASGWLQQLKDRISDPDSGTEPVHQPEALAATLRDYQLRGLRWLARMTELGLGGCLADDMGLGKTVTLIALHLHRQTDPTTAGPTLVVCPASLLGNWEREITRFAPGTPVRRFHGTRRDLDGLANGFVLTTYGTMRRDADRLSADVDGDRGWGLLVADEAQHVKNHRSGTARQLRRIPALARVALTGTPVENNLTELWAVLDWTTPGLLGPLGAFRTRWAAPIESGREPRTAERFARLIAPFLLRRRKSDPGIAPELPPKTETDQPVALTREQAALYEATVRELMAEIEGTSGIVRRGRVVKLLTGLKQICNHPAQYLKEDKPQLDGRSGKLELLDELVDTILAEDGAVLVFTQYVAMARLIERHLAGRGVATQLLHGGTPVPRREEMVARFQAGEVPVFLLSLKAAGTGLNLTRADHVVHFDRWWNPAVEDQATDRAYRIGQTRPVQVHRLIAEGTIEDRIAGLLASKRALADTVLASGEAALTELTDAELADLVELRSAR